MALLDLPSWATMLFASGSFETRRINGVWKTSYLYSRLHARNLCQSSKRNLYFLCDKTIFFLLIQFACAMLFFGLLYVYCRYVHKNACWIASKDT